MPDPLELPRMLRAVVPLVCSGNAFINEFVALAFRHSVRSRLQSAPRRLPGPAAIIGTLDHLSEPGTALRGVDAIRVGGRTFQMIHFPAGKVRTVDVPFRARPIRAQDEGAFARAYQNPDPAHGSGGGAGETRARTGPCFVRFHHPVTRR